MKILITGITGLLGSYIAREFAGTAEIYGFKRPGSSLRLLDGIETEIIWHEGNISNVEELEEAVAGKDLVIHAAGMVSFDSRDEKLLYEVNNIGTANLVNAMLTAGNKKLVHISSVAAIGRSPELSSIDEEHKWTDSPFNTSYATSKYFGELEAWRGEQEGLDLIVVNPSVLLGKVSDDRSSTEIYHYVLAEHSYYPKGDLNYLDVRDAAKLIRLLVDKEAWGQRFILNNKSISYYDFFSEMARVFNKKAPSIPATPFLIRVAVFYNGFLRRFGLSKNPLNLQTAMIAQQKLLYDNRKLLELIDFKFTSLENTFKWAK